MAGKASSPGGGGSCVDSVKKRSSEGLEGVRVELEEREKVCDELHSVQLWTEAADVLLTEVEEGRSAGGLQVRRSSAQVTCCLLLILHYLCKQRKLLGWLLQQKL